MQSTSIADHPAGGWLHSSTCAELPTSSADKNCGIIGARVYTALTNTHFRRNLCRLCEGFRLGKSALSPPLTKNNKPRVRSMTLNIETLSSKGNGWKGGTLKRDLGILRLFVYYHVYLATWDWLFITMFTWQHETDCLLPCLLGNMRLIVCYNVYLATWGWLFITMFTRQHEADCLLQCLLGNMRLIVYYHVY